jgi:hypothetical protein
MAFAEDARAQAPYMQQPCNSHATADNNAFMFTPLQQLLRRRRPRAVQQTGRPCLSSFSFSSSPH